MNISDQIYGDIKMLDAEMMASLLSMDEAIGAMGKAFSAFSDGSCIVPQRHVSGINKLDLFLKPAYSEKLGRAAVKVITQKKDGSINGIPSILGVVLLIDLKSGAILTIMDGAYITALRTGAAGGLAAKLFSKENSETLAIFGCGVQGKTQMEAVCAIRPIKKVLLYDLNKEKAEELKKEMEEKLHLNISVEKNTHRLKTADIICTATNSEKPLFSLEDISRSVHINAIGSYKPHMQEIDPQIINAGTLFVDSKESVLKESGDLIKPISANIFANTVIEAEIGEHLNMGDTSSKYLSYLTIFKSVGLGVQDLFVASAIFDRYLLK